MLAKIVRPMTGRIQIRGLRAPRGDEPTNKGMFKSATGTSIRPTWVDAPEGTPGWAGHWTLSRKHLTDVAEAIAIRDGRVLIEMHYSLTDTCDTRCQEATGNDCTCSCEGKFHGVGEHAAWLSVGKTTLVRGSGEKIITRELTREQAKKDREDYLRRVLIEMGATVSG